MTTNTTFSEFCERWIAKANQYDESTLENCFDKFFTLFVVYNALYVEASAVIVRKAAKAGNDDKRLSRGSFPDRKAATAWVLEYKGCHALWNALMSNKDSADCIPSLIKVLESNQFYIKLDPATGDPKPTEDSDLVHKLKSDNCHEKAMSLLEIIYQVRCNMFHGRKGLDPVQKKLLDPLNCILAALIEYLFEQLNKEPYV